MPPLTAFALVVVTACVIALVQEGKDQTIKSCAAVTLILGMVFALHSYISFLRDIAPSHGTLFIILAVANAVLGLVIALRLKNRVVGTLACAFAAVIALDALRVIG